MPVRHALTTGGLLRQLVREESAQDVIEYALLSALVGIVGILAWQNIGVGVGETYAWWDAGVQDLSGCTPDPGGLGCGASGGS